MQGMGRRMRRRLLVSPAWTPLVDADHQISVASSSSLSLYVSYQEQDNEEDREEEEEEEEEGSRSSHGRRRQGRSLQALDALDSDGIYRVRGKDIDITGVAPAGDWPHVEGGVKTPVRGHLPNCTVSMKPKPIAA